MKRPVSRRRLACATLILITLPPLVWLCGSGTRPDVPLRTFLPAHAPILLEVHEPKTLRDILRHPSTNRKIQALEAVFLSCHPHHSGCKAAEDATHPPQHSGSSGKESQPAQPVSLYEESAWLRLLLDRLTSLALTFDPTTPGEPVLHLVCTVDNAGQALLRIALPFLGEGTAAGRRIRIDRDTVGEVSHVGGSLFRILVTSPPLSPATPLPQTALPAPHDTRHPDPHGIATLWMDGRLFPPDLGMKDLRITLATEGDGSLVTAALEMGIPTSIPVPPATAIPVPPPSALLPEHPGLQILLPISLTDLRHLYWSWHAGEAPRAGVAEPWESDLDAVLSALAATSDGGGLHILLTAPPLPADDFGVSPVPQVILRWQSHPDPELAADALDRAMSRLSRSIREFSVHPSNRRVLGQTEWTRHAPGEPGGTIRLHPLYFHHLAPTATRRDGMIHVSTHPMCGVPDSAHAHAGGEGETRIRLQWRDDRDLRRCLVELARDTAIRKGWVPDAHHAQTQRWMTGLDELLQAWPAFGIRLSLPEPGAPRRMRIEWSAPLP